MASDSDLTTRLLEFLRSSDLNTTTTSAVRRQLENDFGIDLSDRKAFIREQVDLFLQTEHHHQDDAQSQQNDAASDSKEEEKVKRARNGKNKRRSDKLGNEIVKKRGGGFCKLCGLSPQLQEFIGVPEMARTEDTNNRRNIICDEPLRALFGVDSINMFQMNKALSKHIWPLDSDDVVQVKSAPKEKQKKQEREDDLDEPKRKEKRQKGGKSGFLAPIQLSDALVNFLGTGESALSRSDVIKRVWGYIKGNNLQDPSDKRNIICDNKLKELFDVDSFNGFTVTKQLAPHFIKTEQ